MLDHADVFDFSNYLAESNHRSAQNPYLRENTKKINVMKDEMGMAPILEYVGLRAKVYSLHVADEVVAEMDNFVPVKWKGVCHAVYTKIFVFFFAKISLYNWLPDFWRYIFFFRCSKVSRETPDPPSTSAEIPDSHRQKASDF